MRVKTETLIRKYKDNLFAVAFNVCKSPEDAEDIVQDTFVAYHTSRKDFENEEHVKAWLIRVAINRAINVNRSFWRKKSVPLDDSASLVLLRGLQHFRYCEIAVYLGE